MQCADFKKFLSRFLEHELGAAEEKSLRQHLDSCTSCTRTLASLEHMMRLLGTLDSVEPSPHFAELVNQKIDRPGWPERIRRRVASWGIVNMPYPAVAVGGAFMLALFLSYYAATLSPLGKGVTSEDASLQLASSVEPRQPVSVPVESTPAPSSASQRPQADYLADSLRVAGSSMAQPVTTVSSSPAPAVVSTPSGMNIPLRSEAPVGSYSITVQAGDLIFAHRQQNWLLTVETPIGEAAEIVMDSLRQARVESLAQSQGTGADEITVIINFIVPYGRLSRTIESLRQTGSFTRITPLPIPRPEAYLGTHGPVNPKVLEEQISVELRIVR